MIRNDHAGSIPVSSTNIIYMIYTSYFGYLFNLPRDFIKFGIVRYLKLDLINFDWLAPSKELLCDIKYKGLSNDEYVNRYLKEFSKDKLDKLKNLCDKCGDTKIVLLCYETPDKFCHRHIVSSIIKKLGYQSTEFNFDITTNKYYNLIEDKVKCYI